MRNNQPVNTNEYILSADQTLVSVTDLKGRIVYCNRAFIEASGYSREELLGQPHNIVRHPDMPQEAFRDLWATLSAQRPWSALVKNRRKDGSHYWVKAHAVPMCEGQQVIGYLSVRTAPAREAVRQTAALYATMQAQERDGRLRLVLRGGELRELTPTGWLRVVHRESQTALGGPLRVVSLGATVALSLAAGETLPVGWATTVAVPAALGLGLLCQRAEERRAQAVAEDAVRLASGDLAHVPRSDAAGALRLIQAALGQLAVNTRTLIGDSREELLQVAAAAREIASGNQDLSQRTDAQAGALHQTATAMEQIHVTTLNCAQAAEEGVRKADGTDQVARESHQAVQQVAQAMTGIKDSSARIGEIIQVVEGVAFQTNLLALNAAVEAARAGEAGKGFAVVATEVRALAARTSSAAREIKQLVQESASRVARGGQHSDEASRRMEGALSAVDGVRTALGEISAAAGQQRVGIGEVNAAIAELEDVTRRNAGLVEQLSGTAQLLDEKVAQATQTMRLFRIRPGEPTLMADAVSLRRAMKVA